MCSSTPEDYNSERMTSAASCSAAYVIEAPSLVGNSEQITTGASRTSSGR